MQSLAAFIDLNSIRLGANMLEKALSQIDCENIVGMCFYNYDPDRNSAFDGIIARYGAQTAPLSDGRKRIRTDMRLAVDAVAATERLRPKAVFLVCGAIDRAPLAERIAEIGTNVIIGTENVSEYELNPFGKLYGNEKISYLLFDRTAEIEGVSPRAIPSLPKHAKDASDASKNEEKAKKGVLEIAKESEQIPSDENNDGNDDSDCDSEIGNNVYCPTDRAETRSALLGINKITAEKVRAASVENTVKNTDLEAKKALVTEKLLKAIALSKATGVDKEVAEANLTKIKETLLKLLAKEKSLAKDADNI